MSSDDILWWCGSAGGYLHFTAALGWFVCAGLTICLALPSHAESAERPNRRIWWVIASAFLLLGVAASGALLGAHGPLFARVIRADPLGDLAAVLALATLLGCTGAPASRAGAISWRIVIILGAAAAVIARFCLPIAFPWCVIVLGIGGALWLAAPFHGRLFADASVPGRVVVLLLAATCAAVGLGRLATTLLSETSATTADDQGRLISAATLTAGSWLALTAIWWLYLQGRTLPRIREHRTFLRLPSVCLFPLAHVVVVAAGFVMMKTTVGQTEGYAERRIVDELRAVASSLTWQPIGRVEPDDSPELLATEESLAAGHQLEGQIRRLLAASSAYRAAVLWSADVSGPTVLIALHRDGTRANAVARLLPRDRTELRTAWNNTPLVRWRETQTRFETIVVMLSVRNLLGVQPDWVLSLEIEVRGLADLITANHLQTLVIVALIAIAVGFAVVYTVRSLNEAELRSLKESAEKENQTRNQFLAMISHEVRTPLQSVLGYAELAAASPELTPAVTRHLHAIRSQGAALQRIVQDFLDFSALRSGRFNLSPEPLVLRQMIGEVHDAFVERAHQKGLELSCTVAAEVPPAVRGDRVRLQQVLVNLVGNAVKFTSSGSVHLTLTSAPGDTNGNETANLEFVVVDTGPGFTPEEMPRVFEPFRKLRGDGVHATGGSGMGLGLAICRQIVEHMHGTISLESRTPRGSCFRVRLELPLADPSIATPPATVSAAGFSELPLDTGVLAGRRVLLVDDHPHVRELIGSMLTHLGAEVVAVATAAAALLALQSQHFEVVLLDLKLPDMRGEDLAHEMRRRGRSETAPWIIGISAGITDEELQCAFSQGLNDFLIKPVSLEGLAETLQLSPVVKSPPGAAGRIDPRKPSEAERQALAEGLWPSIERIASACAEGLGPEAAAEAHYLANSCGLLGLTEARDCCREIEVLAQRGTLAAALAAMERLRTSVEKAAVKGTAV